MNVLWNNEMDLCIGLMTEMDRDEFARDVLESHKMLTGESIRPEDGEVSVVDHIIWKFQLK
ncbi:hypothetical protein HNQ80_004345 [Anaerosolibacter carboniphilus]|uniref:Uncharacterized protein n=1 Tax=Anaerosolibacter carboniphilus TaxID=1417629 RepID=A0A841L7G0_9FIRM|nr:hypothetical protein [Anaerosolibacter carboniphilus]MBB6218205.1 hypothetical protein [Anaerosolibacter carboniphilus]